MIDEAFIRSLGLMIIAAAAFASLARKLGVPTIVGYLVAGVVLGPATHVIDDARVVSLISEIGIILLLFLVGLELDIAKIRNLGKVAVLAGTGQIVVTSFLSFGCCILLGFELRTSLVMAAALTFSSTVVVVKVLAEKKELDALHGRIAIGVLLVQDLAAILLLTVLAGLQEGSDFSLSQTLGNTIQAIGGIVTILVVALLASRFILLRLLTWAITYPGMLFIWSLCWCFALVQIAHWFHLSHEIGAFMAGVSLAQLPFQHELARRVNPLMNFFIAVFFTSLGINLNLDIPTRYWITAAALTLFVLVGKFAVVMLTASRLRIDEKSSYFSGVLLCQISEFSLIFATLAFSKGLIDETALSIIGLVGLATISLSAYGIQYKTFLYRFVRHRRLLSPFQATAASPPAPTVKSLHQHVILVGVNSLGIYIVDQLLDRGETVLAIDTNPQRLAPLKCRTLVGNAEDWALLEEANLPQAKLLVSALHIEDTNDLLAYRCRQLQIPCAIHAVDLEETDNLLEMDATYLMIPKVDGIKLQNQQLGKLGFLKT
ncbi:MAG: Glutathione-regulated potassium-efflux system protein KefC [Verrucomicrobia subdivision 3 bacterium]|nr:Glutathione-regulated potassium-efflux system protein KefC [Limisphaerales bacterium]MCS1414102.1 Glutathione-regulated potassium-efflux system protein KefC [Limisphaerales bacterium]